jgi:hypothetical protein
MLYNTGPGARISINVAGESAILFVTRWQRNRMKARWFKFQQKV